MWPIPTLLRLKNQQLLSLLHITLKQSILSVCPTTDSPFSLLQKHDEKDSFKCMAENFMQRHSFFVILTQKQYRLDTS